MGAPKVGDLGVLTAVGDLVTQDGNNDAERLPVGADGSVLLADSAEALGLRWAGAGDVLAHSMVYGAGMGAGDTGKAFEAHGVSNGGKIDMGSAPYRAQITAARAGQLVVAWSFQNAITEIKIQIHKNGVLVGVPTSLTTQRGTKLLADTVAKGDFIAVIFHSIVAGSTPGQSIIELFPT